MGAVLSIPGQFWGRKRKKKGGEGSAGCSLGCAPAPGGPKLLEKGRAGMDVAPDPLCSCSPQPPAAAQGLEGAFWGPFCGQGARRCAPFPCQRAHAMGSWSPGVVPSKIAPGYGTAGAPLAAPLCYICLSPCPQLGGVPKPPSPRLSSAGCPLPASSVGRVGFPSCAIRRPAGSQERSEPATALAPSPLCSPGRGGGTRQGWVLSPAVPPPAHLRAGWGAAGGKLRQGEGRKTHPGATPEPCRASGRAGCPRV